jgi:hypothetical protein
MLYYVCDVIDNFFTIGRRDVKRNGWLVLILISIMALSLPALTQCTQPGQAVGELDGLAHRVPSDADQAFFMDFKPDGEAGRHWERIRQHLAANPTGQQALDGLFHTFGVELSGLDEFIVGPAVSGYSDGAAVEYAILQVSDEGAAEDSLRQRFPRAAWEQEEGLDAPSRAEPGFLAATGLGGLGHRRRAPVPVLLVRL